MSSLGHGLRLARVDVVRMVRRYTDTSRGLAHLASLAVFVLALVGATAGGGYLAFRAGEGLESGDLGAVGGMEILRGIVAVFGLVVAVVVLVRAVGQRGTLTNAEGVLTVVPTGQALGGLLLAEVGYVLLWLGGPALGVGVGLALGTGSPVPLLTVPLAVLAVGVTAVAVGYPVGLGVRHVATRFPFVVRHKVALLGLAFVGYIGLVATGALNAVVVALFEPMQGSPTGWVADLAVLGTPGLSPSLPRAAGSVGVTAVLGVGALVVGTRLAERHWFSDPALAGETEPDTPEESDRSAVERRLAAHAGRGTAALTVVAWRRARRAPMKLLYVAYPLLFGVGAFADIVQTGRVPAYLPFATLLFVAWAAGVLFTLNPLGDQGAALSTTLLSPTTGRQFVHAHLLASLLVAVPFGVVVTAVVALLSPVGPTTTAFLVAATPPVMVVASAASVGIGTAFPRFRAVNVTRSIETVAPSKVAFALFSLHLVGTVLAGVLVADEGIRGLVAALLSWLLPVAVEPGTLLLVAGVGLAVLVTAPAFSYRYAIRTFDTYTLE